jgi:hypothetical protein
MGYRKECCKIFGYIQNLKFKKSGPTIVGLDALATQNLIVSYSYFYFYAETRKKNLSGATSLVSFGRRLGALIRH